MKIQTNADVDDFANRVLQGGRRSSSVSTRFDEAIRRAGPEENDLQLAKDRHMGVSQLLQKQSWVKRTFLSGSYKRHTATNPINDVDVFVVVEDVMLQDVKVANEAIVRLCNQVISPNLRCTKVVDQEHSVGLEWLFGPKIDVVLARSRGDSPDEGYDITNAKGMWITTFPEQAFRAATEANDRCDRLIPLIKLLKCWNGHHVRKNAEGKLKKALKSYHLEVMCYRADLRGESNDRRRFLRLLTHVYVKLDDSKLAAPGPGGRRFHEYLESGKHPWTLHELRNLFYDAIQIASNASTAEEQRKTLEAHQWWEKVLTKLY